MPFYTNKHDIILCGTQPFKMRTGNIKPNSNLKITTFKKKPIAVLRYGLDYFSMALSRQIFRGTVLESFNTSYGMTVCFIIAILKHTFSKSSNNNG
jgi:hypothetical protein